jgi:hypothetical protein
MAFPNNHTWTSSEIQRVKTLLAEGKPQREIGAVIGVSRRAVASVILRYGLTTHRNTAAPAREIET